MPKQTILAIEDLDLTYRSARRVTHALRGASISVAASEAVGLVGESGCGKSTLARVAMGLLPDNARIESGRVLIDRRDVTRLDQGGWDALRGNPVAIVFQDPLSYLNPVMRVDRQIAEGVRLHDPGADVGQRVSELLDLVRLRATVARTYPHELSGGMRQRVLLAIALGCRPSVLIADEPTTALDVTTQAEILKLLAEIRVELGMGLLLISHDLSVVSSICQQIYVMYAGRTVEWGSTNDVLSFPAHPYTYALMQAAAAIRTADGRFATIAGEASSFEREYSGCPFVDRCPYCIPVCSVEMPLAFEAKPGNDHYSRCWLLSQR